MRCLIRTVTRASASHATFKDSECLGDRVTIGRAVGQHVFLPDLRVTLRHARIALAENGRFAIVSRAPSGFLHNGQTTQQAYLQTGDRILLGGYEIRVIPPPADYDLALEVERSRSAKGQELREALMSRVRIGLAATGFGMRRWSWALLLLILVAFLAVPAAGLFHPPLSEKLRAIPGLPSDKVWDVGELASSHHYFGTDCNMCHQKPFIPVRNEACLSCHQGQPWHIDPSLPVVKSPDTDCTVCHKDHNGPEGLIRTESRFCTPCHSKLNAQLSDTGLFTTISDFSHTHPQFKVSLLEPGAGTQRAVRIRLDWTGDLRERSNLKFPHAKHLQAGGVKGPNGQVKLDCASCHTPEAGGQHMQPIRFEKNCHGCHRLTFDPTEPDREAPHGNVQAVLQTLESYYALRALEGGYADPAAPEIVRRRRRPGEQFADEERAAALEWATQKSATVGAELFEYRACAICHTVDKPEPAVPAWRISPVALAQAWFPKAHFTHARHATMDCAACHDAAHSTSSADVLMPGIENCRSCHGDVGDRDRLQSTCVSCHDFHLIDRPPQHAALPSPHPLAQAP
ncbi:MAG: FHA domain-containing protein [Gammaproteobacteria bacterium]|nr:FHA domain-containing protein [Gammaproteobacteria bacterium]MCP5424900.1 FHA domain-containing protein [Gammaproteobacteria bacterium]MCP5458124.1 FHA domain-containing protein [Gammaproteobacteria bacterium]